MSLTPVTGRGSLGPLPSEYDGLFGSIQIPLCGGDNSHPLTHANILSQQKEVHCMRFQVFWSLHNLVFD